MFSCLAKVFFKLNGIKYGKKLRLRGLPCIIRRQGQITIGNNVIINSGFTSNFIGLNHRTVIISRCPESKIEIGDNVGMSGTAIYARSQITIGKGTMIGANTKILDNDFHPIDIEARRIDDKSKIGVKPVVIGEDCFIGCNALILKGTTLGRGCVVGAGAVVSGTFEDGSVIVGNPAKTIRIQELNND